MTKEPADWAKIKAYRAVYPSGIADAASILEDWESCIQCHELARMYDKYEQPPVDPDLLAAREWYAKRFTAAIGGRILEGNYDTDKGVRDFLAGIKHGRTNP